jgi:hypothetical protein
MCKWSSSDVQRVLLYLDHNTGMAALPLAIIYGHVDIAHRILELDDSSSTTESPASHVRSRVYANGLSAACLAAGGGQPELLKKILRGGGCDLSVVCAAAGAGKFLNDKFPSILTAINSKNISETFTLTLQLALSSAAISRVELNDVWGGRQPLWFACRTGDHAAARAIMSASFTVKPALTTEVKFKLDLQRHHTPLQAAAASGDEKMIAWLLTCVDSGFEPNHY